MNNSHSSHQVAELVQSNLITRWHLSNICIYIRNLVFQDPSDQILFIFSLEIKQINPFKPEFTIVIFIHYKSRIAAAILDLYWMKMT